MIAELLGPGGGAIRGAFERMGVAEEELERAGVGDMPGAFIAMCPKMDEMSNCAVWVYRAHARELCERLLRGEDISPATWAEVALVCSTASSVAPLTEQASLTYHRALLETCRLGDHQIDIAGLNPGWREPWLGAIDEMVAGLRQRTRFDRSKA